jgi:hypothetical protein
VPGITKVTDRARYLFFYPWPIWAVEQAGRLWDVSDIKTLLFGKWLTGIVVSSIVPPLGFLNLQIPFLDQISSLPVQYKFAGISYDLLTQGRSGLLLIKLD